MFQFNYLKKTQIAGLLLVITVFANSQTTYYGDGPVLWENNTPYTIPPEAAAYDNADVVVLSDVAEFHFYSGYSEKLVRNVKYKINTAKGLMLLKHFKTPESFDMASDQHFFKQGRYTHNTIPFLREYKVKTFAARHFSRSRWSNVTVKDSYEPIRWIRSSGEFLDEDVLVLKLGSLQVGDVVEVFYEATFKNYYGNNLFYFNGPYPKLSCEYNFIYKTHIHTKDVVFLKPLNVDSSKIKELTAKDGEDLEKTIRIKLNNLNAINYPVNSSHGNVLPHVYVDFNAYRTYSLDKENSKIAGSFQSKNFEWGTLLLDTSSNKPMRIYDKHHNDLRKFIKTLPPVGNDEQNVTFIKALNDTLNNFRYMTANHLYYNESELYGLSSSDHLLKRRLPSHVRKKMVSDILNDQELFYYLVNIQDKRLGEHSIKHHVHFGYENSLLALPLRNSTVYFMARPVGIKYYLNELPFYLEDALAVQIPINFKGGITERERGMLQFRKTPNSTHSDNKRTENALVKIVLDSLKAHLSISESLSGQFSTLLRHIYLNELIDSTVSAHYFKKCVDKPGASSVKIKKTTLASEFPFTGNFECKADITISSANTLSLYNWFSFPLSKNVIPQKPTHDYYFDFEFSDKYNFLFDFGKAVTVTNAETFSKKINNDYFELESDLARNSANAYQLRLKLLVKQSRLPKDKADLLMELVEALEQLNNFELVFQVK